MMTRLLGGRLLGGSGCLGHVVVLFWGLVVVGGCGGVVVVFVVVIVGVVCNLETRGGDISNDANK